MNKKPSFSALLLGATGLVGNYCLQNLLQDPQYTRITVLSRRALSYQHFKLKVHLINFEKLKDFAELMVCDHIFCTLGNTPKAAGSKDASRKVNFSYPLEVARISSKNGAHQFLLVSALTASKESRIFYNRVKGELEEAVASLPFQTVLIFRPSLILGKRQEKRAGERMTQIISQLLTPLLVGKIRNYRPIHARVLARSMTEIAKIQLSGVQTFTTDQMQFFYEQLLKKEISH